MFETKNTFSEGLNRDLSLSKYKNTMYYDLVNMRPMSDDGLSTGSLENVKGNLLQFSIPTVSSVYRITTNYNNIDTILASANVYLNTYPLNETKVVKSLSNKNELAIYNLDGVDADIDSVILYLQGIYSITVTQDLSSIDGSLLLPIGYAQLGRDTVLFTTSNTTTTTSNADGQLWLLTVDNTSSDTPSVSISLLYNNLLGFSTQYPITNEAIGLYENDLVKHVYFTDNNNPLRSCNIADQNLMALNPSGFDIIPNFSLGEVQCTTISTGGVYKSGCVQYAYQLYNLNGAQTKFSPVSNLIDLTDKIETAATSDLYYGQATTLTSGKSVQVDITGIDTTFDYIKVVALFYQNLTSTPEITIVKEEPVSSSISFTDTGNIEIGTFTYAEFTTIGNDLFTCKTITSKDNYLIAGNISEKYFDLDFDTRSYRYQKLSTLTYATDTSETADCINPDQEVYAYQESSDLLGGTGVNIDYQFRMKSVNGDSNMHDRALYNTNTSVSTIHYLNNSVYDDNYFPNSTSSQIISNVFRGYQRGEVYRFGIVFFDSKGRQSFAKWIADIKMPSMSDIDGKVQYNDGATDYYDFCTAYYNTTYGTNDCNNLYVEFTLKNLHLLPSEVQGYQIVRVKREESDRSILAQGMFVEMGALQNMSGNIYRVIDSLSVGQWTSPWSVFYSPEISFNKNLSFLQGDYIEIASKIHNITYNIDVALTGARERVTKARGTVAITPSATTKTNPIVKAKLVAHDEIADVAADHPFYNHYRNGGSGIECFHSTCLALNAPNLSGSTTIYPIVNYRRSRPNQYNGNTYASRATNEYIAASNLCDLTVTVCSCFGGDTFVQYYDHLSVSYAQDDVNSGYLGINYFPVETSINLNMRHDTCYSRIGAPASNPLQGQWKLQETVAQGVAVFGANYIVGATDLYLYNSVYSREEDTIKFLAKPLGYQNVTKKPTLLIASEKKIYGEQIDSWTQFKYNNIIELNKSYGEVNKLIDHKNYVLAFQDSAFGVASINDRSLIQDTTGSQLILGTGTVLARFDYISQKVGTKHKNSVTKSIDALYWYDSNHKNIYTWKEGLGSLSDILGLNSFFNNELIGYIQDNDNPICANSNGIIAGFSSWFDTTHNEVVFTIQYNGYELYTPQQKQFTIAYNELFSKFTAFYSCYPGLYVPVNQLMLSCLPNSSDLYLQNYGEYGKFFGTYYPSQLEIVVNPSPDSIKTFTNIFLNTQVDKNGSEYLDGTYTPETLTTLRCFNDYQDTDVQNLYQIGQAVPGTNPLPIRRRFRIYRTALPRSKSLINGDRNDARLKGQYIRERFTYTNNANKRLVIHDITNNFLVQNTKVF